MTGFERVPSVAAYLPSEVARLVLGYLKDEGCAKTYRVFLDECSHLQEYAVLLKGGLSYPMCVDGKSLVSVLNEHRSLRLEDLQPRDAGTMSTLWRRFDIVVNQLKLVHGLGPASTRIQRVLGASSQRAFHRQLGGSVGGGGQCVRPSGNEAQPSVGGSAVDCPAINSAEPALPTCAAVPASSYAATAATGSPAARGGGDLMPCRAGTAATAAVSSASSAMMLPSFVLAAPGSLAATPVPIAPRPPPSVALSAPLPPVCGACPAVSAAAAAASTSSEAAARVDAAAANAPSRQRLYAAAASPLPVTAVTASSSPTIPSAVLQCSTTSHVESSTDSGLEPTSVTMALQATYDEVCVQEVTQETDADLVGSDMCDASSASCTFSASATTAPASSAAGAVLPPVAAVIGSPARRKRSSAERKKRMTPGKNLSPGKEEAIENLSDLFPMPCLVEKLLEATEWQQHLAENINRHLTRRSTERGPDEAQGAVEVAATIAADPPEEPVVRFEESETEAAIREVLAITRSDPTFGDFHALMDCAYLHWNGDAHESSVNSHYDPTLCYSDVVTIRTGLHDVVAETSCATDQDLPRMLPLQSVESPQQQQQLLQLQEQQQLLLQQLQEQQLLQQHDTVRDDSRRCAAAARECRPIEVVTGSTPASHLAQASCSTLGQVDDVGSTSIAATASSVELPSLPSAAGPAGTGPAADGLHVAAAALATAKPHAAARLTVYPVRSSARLRQAGVPLSAGTRAGLPCTGTALPAVALADGVTPPPTGSLHSSAASSVGESPAAADGFVNLAPHTTDSGTTMYLVISNGNNVDKRIISRGSTPTGCHNVSKRPSAHAVRRIRPLCPANMSALSAGPLSAASSAPSLAPAEQAPAESSQVPAIAVVTRQRSRKKTPTGSRRSVRSDSSIPGTGLDQSSGSGAVQAKKPAGLRKDGRHVRVLTFSPSRQSEAPGAARDPDSDRTTSCSRGAGRTRGASTSSRSRTAAGRVGRGEPCAAVTAAATSPRRAGRSGRHALPDAGTTAAVAEDAVPELVGQLVHVVERQEQRRPPLAPPGAAVAAGTDFVVLSCDGAELGRVTGISASDEEELFRQFTIVDDQCGALGADSAACAAAAGDRCRAAAASSPAAGEPASVIAVTRASVQQKRPPDESAPALHSATIAAATATAGTQGSVSSARSVCSSKKPRLKDIDIEKFLSKIHK